MTTFQRTILLTATLATLGLASCSPNNQAVAAGELVNIAGASGVALDGYDPVAFFTEKKPTNGDPSITAKHLGATYFFANKDHQKKFTADPEKYAPQFGGFCAYGAAVDALFPADVSTWQIRDDKLYLNLNAKVVEAFNSDIDSNIAKATKNWPGLVGKHAAKPTS